MEQTMKNLSDEGVNCYTRLIPASELETRIAGLQKTLASLDIGGVLIVQKADLFY